MLRRILLICALACSFAGAALAANPADSLPGGWSHAELNVVGPHGRAHTYIYDRGRVTAVSASSLTLKESDGSVVTIQVAPDAVIVIGGQPGSFSQIVPGAWAQTLGIDGAPAKRVSAKLPPPPPVITHTFGRVRAVGPSSLTLRQPDGSMVTVEVAPNAAVFVNGQPGSLSQIQVGFHATATSVNGAPARRVTATGLAPRGPTGSSTSTP